jgi:pilus assembly protein CpaE
MASNLHPADGARVRVFLTGTAAVFDELHASLSPRAELELLEAGAELNGNVDVVLHAARGERPLADELAAVREQTHAPIVLVASSNIQSVLEQALTAELADVLVMPQPTEAVLYAIRRIARDGAPDSDDGGRGRVVTVFSPKGGAGKTVVATNLAMALAQGEQRTLLVDLDLHFGDAALMLGLVPEKTVFDLVASPGELDADKLAGYTTAHESGVALLAAPARPEHGENVREAGIARVIDVARDAYDAVVIDTAPAFDASMLAALDRSDDLVLLTGPDVASLKNVRLALQTLDALAFPRERLSVLHNRKGAPGGIKTQDIAHALGHPVRFTLPEDRAVVVGVNRGNPVVHSTERARFSQELCGVAAALVPALAAPPAARRRLGRRS